MVYRIRLIEPISADFAVLVGDAIRNLRSSLDAVAYQLAVQHSGPLTEDAERMTELPIRISGAQFDDWATSKNKQTKLRRSEIFGKRDSGRFARDSRSRSPSGCGDRRRIEGVRRLADRRRLRGTTMSASSSTGCGMSTSTDAYLCWRPRLPAKAAARLAAWSSSPCRISPRRCGRLSAV